MSPARTRTSTPVGSRSRMNSAPPSACISKWRSDMIWSFICRPASREYGDSTAVAEERHQRHSVSESQADQGGQRGVLLAVLYSCDGDRVKARSFRGFLLRESSGL